MLLKELYGGIVIPPAVFSELQRNGIPIAFDWIQVIVPQNRAAVQILRSELDAGGSEAIVLAQELPVCLLLIDERLGRRAAKRMGLEVTGLLGILAESKKRGIVPLCAPILDEMIEQAGFWIGGQSSIRLLESTRRNRLAGPFCGKLIREHAPQRW